MAIREAAELRERRRNAYDAADAELRRRICEGFEQEIPGVRIAEAAQLSPTRVSEIRNTQEWSVSRRIREIADRSIMEEPDDLPRFRGACIAADLRKIADDLDITADAEDESGRLIPNTALNTALNTLDTALQKLIDLHNAADTALHAWDEYTHNRAMIAYQRCDHAHEELRKLVEFEDGSQRTSTKSQWTTPTTQS